jgi:hypothetical protein
LQQDVLIDVCQADVAGLNGCGGGAFQYSDDVARLYAPLLVETEVALNLDLPAGDQLTNLRPGRAIQKIFERGGESLAGELRRDVEH